MFLSLDLKSFMVPIRKMFFMNKQMAFTKDLNFELQKYEMIPAIVMPEPERYFQYVFMNSITNPSSGSF